MTIPIMNMQQHVRQVNPYGVRGCTDLANGAGATNTAVTALLPAPAKDANGVVPDNVIAQIFWSYSAAGAGGRLTIADSSGTIYDQDIGSVAKGVETFTPPLKSAVQGSALTVTLGAVAAVTGKVAVRGWVEL
jgi:hypothetical protein